MAFTRPLQPLPTAAQRAPRLVSRLVVQSIIGRRPLNTDTAPILYSAHAKVKRARTGRVEGDDLNVALTMSKALGDAGDKGKTDPEELFAAGYGACFQSSMNAMVPTLKIRMPKDLEESVIDMTVHVVGDMKKLDMGLRIDMKVGVRGLENDKIEKIVEKAAEICPYSRAIEGNVTMNVEVIQL